MSPDKLIIEEALLNNISCEREKGDFKFKIKGGKGPYNLLIGDELFKNIELICATQLNTLSLIKAKQIILTPLALNDIKETFCG